MKKYYLYYNKNTNLRVDIKETNTSKQFNYITIDENQYQEIMKGLNEKKICKVKNGDYYLEVNETLKRDELKQTQSELLSEMNIYLDDSFQKILNLTEEDIVDLYIYKDDVLTILTDYDESYNKQEFKIIFVDSKTEENIEPQDLIEKELVKPKFIK